MPQTELKHEFFAIIGLKLLLILGIARNVFLWISLCIDLFHRIIPGQADFNVTILTIFFMMLHSF